MRLLLGVKSVIKCLSGLYRDGTAHSFFALLFLFWVSDKRVVLDIGQPITPERGINKKTI